MMIDVKAAGKRTLSSRKYVYSISIDQSLLLLRHNHRINYVYDTIGAGDVSLDHIGVVNHHFVAFDGNFGGRTLNCLRRFDLHNVFGHNISGDNVIKQNVLQCFLIVDKSVQFVLWDFGESFVCWGKNCEWAIAFQGFNQSSGLHCRHQRVEATGGNSCVNNVFCRVDVC